MAPGYNRADIIGPHTALGTIPGVSPHPVWKNLDEVMGFPAFPTRLTTTFGDCPVLYAGAVPAEVFEDAEILEFLGFPGCAARCGGGRNAPGSFPVRSFPRS